MLLCLYHHSHLGGAIHGGSVEAISLGAKHHWISIGTKLKTKPVMEPWNWNQAVGQGEVMIVM